MNRKNLENEELKYARMLNEIDTRLKTVPYGRLKIQFKADKPTFYICTEGSNGEYLSQSNPKQEETIKLLAQKRYWLQAQKVLEKNIEAIRNALNKTDTTTLAQVYSELPTCIKQYVEPFEITNEEYCQRWINIPFKTSTREKHNNYITKTGVQVRSKSELIIADMLTDHGLPYKYEKQYTLPTANTNYSITSCPDFTVLNKETRQEYIWEHFGLMDKEEYRKIAIEKIQQYSKYCAEHKMKFIATFESENQTLSTEYIEGVISLYFGS